MDRTADEIERLICEWQALRADYVARGSLGLLSFIDGELSKLKDELARLTLDLDLPEPPPA